MKTSVTLAFFLLCRVLFSAECYWLGVTDGGWDDAANWKDGIKPVAGDTVIVEDEDGVITVDDDNIALVSGLEEISLQGTSSKVIFNVSTNANFCSSVSGKGQIVKRGAGGVILTRTDEISVCQTGNGLRIEEGLFSLPVTDVQIGNGNYYLNGVFVGTNGLFGTHAATNASQACNTYVKSLEGWGVVTNLARNGGEYQLRVFGTENKTFEGRVVGRIRFYSAGKYVLAGTNSTFTGNSMMNGGTCGVYCFGKKGMPSSIGVNTEVWSRENGGMYNYLGKGETTDKEFRFVDAQKSSRGHTINGGEYGGLIWAGILYNTGSSNAGWCDRLILSGDNAVPCEVAGPFKEGTARTFTSVTKKGSGTWIFRDHSERCNRGAIFVDEGTLQFESIAETNVVCSLGLSTGWYDNSYTGATNYARPLPYAVRVGNGTTAGVLEYTGTIEARSDTRPIAVKGNGTLKIGEESGDLSIAGIMSADSEGGKLTLDVAEGRTLRISSVKDGEGVLSLEKTGGGTCRMASGSSSFTGNVAVKEGKVILGADPYRWYRFTVMQTGSGNDANIAMQEFALYDKDGNRVNAGMNFIKTYETGNADWTPSIEDFSIVLTNNSATWAMAGKTYLYYTERDMDNLFDDVKTSNGTCVFFTSQISDYSQPSTWVSFAMRIADDTPYVESYDFATAAVNAKTRNPTSWKLEGSRSGGTWTELHRVVSNKVVETSNIWISDETDFAPGQTRKGFDIPTGVYEDDSGFDACTFSVAEGAVLETLTGTEIASLVLDSETNGTFRGFTLAAAGTLRLDVRPPTEGVTIPVVFEDVSGISGAKKWVVSFNGEILPGFGVAFTDTAVRVFSNGTLVILK